MGKIPIDPVEQALSRRERLQALKRSIIRFSLLGLFLPPLCYAVGKHVGYSSANAEIASLKAQLSHLETMYVATFPEYDFDTASDDILYLRYKEGYKEGFDYACYVFLNKLPPFCDMSIDEFSLWWDENIDIISEYDIQS